MGKGNTFHTIVAEFGMDVLGLDLPAGYDLITFVALQHNIGPGEKS
jgi:hypothetical protein